MNGSISPIPPMPMTAAEPVAGVKPARTAVAARTAGWALSGLLALFLALAGLYAWVVPPLEGFDAIAHYRAVLYLRATQRPYVLNSATLAASYELITQPPLYHTLAALAAAPWPPAPAQAWVEAMPNPYFEKGLSDRQTLTLPDAPLVALAPLWTARAVSLLGALLAVAATWLLARTLVPQTWTFALAVASLVAFNPVFLYLAVSVTNDAWAAGAIALTVALAVRCAMQTRPPRCWFWAGAAGGLALLAKYSGFLAGLPALVALALYATRQPPQSWGARVALTPMLKAAGWAILGGALVAGYWYGRNLWLYGEPAPLGRMAELIQSLNRPEPWPWPVVVEYLPWLVWSYWGIFVATVAPPAFLETVRVVMLVGLAGLLPAMLRRDGEQYAAKGWTFVLAAVWSLAAVAAVIHWTRTVSYGEQGRLAHVAAPALALLWVMGWQAWLPVRLRPALHLAMAVGMAGLALWGAQVLYQAYRLPPALATPQPDRPLAAHFAGGPVLLGVDLPEGAALAPNRPLPLTLYWTTDQVIPENYTLFLHLADRQDRLLYQFDGLPAQGRHPTRQWRPGEVFADPYTIQVGTIPAPGVATLSLGMYPYADPAQRLEVTDASGAPLGDRVVLAKVRLQPEDIGATHPASDTTALAEWENGIRLAQAEVVMDEAGHPARVDLVWQTAATLHQDYTLFVQVLDGQNQVLAQVDRQPQGGQWPTSTWRAGDTVPDKLELTPAPGQSLDAWQQVITGWYDSTGRRLLLAAPEPGPDYTVLAERAK